MFVPAGDLGVFSLADLYLFYAVVALAGVAALSVMIGGAAWLVTGRGRTALGAAAATAAGAVLLLAGFVAFVWDGRYGWFF